MEILTIKTWKKCEKNYYCEIQFSTLFSLIRPCSLKLFLEKIPSLLADKFSLYPPHYCLPTRIWKPSGISDLAQSSPWLDRFSKFNKRVSPNKSGSKFLNLNKRVNPNIKHLKVCTWSSFSHWSWLDYHFLCCCSNQSCFSLAITFTDPKASLVMPSLNNFFV